MASGRSLWRRVSRSARADRRRDRDLNRILTDTPPAPEPGPPISCEEFDERMRTWDPVAGGLGEWIEAQRGAEPCVAQGLQASRADEDWDAFERYVLAAHYHPSNACTETLCAVLDGRRDDVNSEDVVDALFKVADPASVPALSRALTWAPDWDEFGQLARKAVYALERIGTPEADAAIRETPVDTLPMKAAEAAADAIEASDHRRETFERMRGALSGDLPEPATAEAVERMEAQLGQRIPPLLRRVYLELANGGWGPDYGAYGLVGGHRDDQGDDALTVYHLLTQPDPEFPDDWVLPRGWLPLLHAGCATQFCVDCRSAGGRVFLIDPGKGAPADCVVWRGASVDEFIRLWLDGDLKRVVYGIE